MARLRDGPIDQSVKSGKFRTLVAKDAYELLAVN
jgi:hypothetical protein